MPNTGYFGTPAGQETRSRDFPHGLLLWKAGKPKVPPPKEKRTEPQYRKIAAGESSDNTRDGSGMTTRRMAGPAISYIQVKNLDRILAYVARIGGTIAVPKTEIPGIGFTAVVTDTEGNDVGLWQMEV